MPRFNRPLNLYSRRVGETPLLGRSDCQIVFADEIRGRNIAVGLIGERGSERAICIKILANVRKACDLF